MIPLNKDRRKLALTAKHTAEKTTTMIVIIIVITTTTTKDGRREGRKE
jgi:hypothetical protein